MNVFVPVSRDTEGNAAALIDFQWTGVGLGMLDVAMHLYHSVELAAMEGGGALLWSVCACVRVCVCACACARVHASARVYDGLHPNYRHTEPFFSTAQARNSCCDTITRD
jgi:hypothetical protein